MSIEKKDLQRKHSDNSQDAAESGYPNNTSYEALVKYLRESGKTRQAEVFEEGLRELRDTLSKLGSTTNGKRA
jgi:hypothetical protein